MLLEHFWVLRTSRGRPTEVPGRSVPAQHRATRLEERRRKSDIGTYTLPMAGFVSIPRLFEGRGRRRD
eukprot:9168812-Pyramimonas_sp.AAC.1